MEDQIYNDKARSLLDKEVEDNIFLIFQQIENVCYYLSCTILLLPLIIFSSIEMQSDLFNE